MRLGTGMLVPLKVAASRCGCQVLLLKGCRHLGNLGAATGTAVRVGFCAMKLGCWCLCRGGCEMSMVMWALGPDRDNVYAASKQAKAWLGQTKTFCYLG